MDIALLGIGFLLMIVGLFGSFLPVVPGLPLSWLGLLLLYLTSIIPMNYWVLGITLALTIIVAVLDYVIPAVGTKRFGGSRYGIIGTTIGLVVGILAPIPGGILIGPFVGAFIGEMLNKSDSKKALRAAFGSFLGFLASSFMSFITAVAFLILFLSKVWEYREVIFA